MIYGIVGYKTRHIMSHVPYSLEVYVLPGFDYGLVDVLDTNNLAFNIYI